MILLFQFVILLLVGLLFCVGIGNAFQYTNFLFPIRSAIEWRMPGKLRKPLWGCLPCMASTYGSLVWWTFGYFCIHDFNILLLLWIIYVGCLSGLNFISDIYFGITNDWE